MIQDHEETPSHAVRLRRLQHSQHHRKSIFAGVEHAQERRRWSASIIDASRGIRRRVHLGSYRREKEAAVAYDFALIILGYPPVNFPASLYRGVEPPSEMAFKLRRGGRVSPYSGAPFPDSSESP